MCASVQTRELTDQVLPNSSTLVQMLRGFLSSQPKSKVNATKLVQNDKHLLHTMPLKLNFKTL